MPDAVRDNPTLSRFELHANGVTAVANYTIAGNVITFTHTEVPPQARGGGTASRLANRGEDATRFRFRRCHDVELGQPRRFRIDCERDRYLFARLPAFHREHPHHRQSMADRNSFLHRR
jgi:hypothetical protein